METIVISTIGSVVSIAVLVVFVVSNVQNSAYRQKRELQENTRDVISELQSVRDSQKVIEIKVTTIETILNQIVKDVDQIKKQQGIANTEIEYLKNLKDNLRVI